MKLRGQHGYAMVVLLVAMAVMAVLATAAMPVWKQLTQREKEAELIFRGEQYVRAIRLFTRRAGPGVLPPNVDLLVQQRYLRKKYKDPITGDDFDLLTAVQASASTPGAPTGRGGQVSTPSAAGRSATPAQSAGGRGGQAVGGIMGVASRSKDSSIRLYNGRSHYNEWQFLYVQQVQQPGVPGQPQRGGQQPIGGVPGIGGRQGPGGRPGAPPPGAGFPPGGPGRFGQPPPAPGGPRPPR